MAYTVQSVLGSIGMERGMWQRAGSCLALSGLTPRSPAAFLKHSQRFRRHCLVSAFWNTSAAPAQQATGGTGGAVAFKYWLQGINVCMAS